MKIITGVFFQLKRSVGIGYSTELGSCAVFIRPEQLFQTFFSGILSIEDNSGTMIDVYGQSIITSISLIENNLIFTKHYLHRSDKILYDFRKNSNGIWIGNYSGQAVGTGKCVCSLQDLPQEFLSEPI